MPATGVQHARARAFSMYVLSRSVPGDSPTIHGNGTNRNARGADQGGRGSAPGSAKRRAGPEQGLQHRLESSDLDAHPDRDLRPHSGDE